MRHNDERITPEMGGQAAVRKLPCGIAGGGWYLRINPADKPINRDFLKIVAKAQGNPDSFRQIVVCASPRRCLAKLSPVGQQQQVRRRRRRV